ncbi:MAG: hypothetical protein WA771_11415, partial [Chthoniobacterales bacterium]
MAVESDWKIDAIQRENREYGRTFAEPGGRSRPRKEDGDSRCPARPSEDYREAALFRRASWRPLSADCFQEQSGLDGLHEVEVET